jgi:hypothetical protein
VVRSSRQYAIDRLALKLEVLDDNIADSAIESARITP